MIKVAVVDQYRGFEDSLIMGLIKEASSKQIELTAPNRCDLLIIGSHRPSYISLVDKAINRLENIFERFGIFKNKFRPIIFFQTWENVRHDFIQADFCMSFDLEVYTDNHFRFPLWMAKIDWSHEGLPIKNCPRLGKSIKIERLMTPLGRLYLSKPKRAALFSSHMNEPRSSLFAALSRLMPVDGYGPAFDKSITNHNESGFTKDMILKNYGFSLCPENSLYPGYYTEKIPEAFVCDTLPITWSDINIGYDFNQDAFVNLLPYAKYGYESALRDLLRPENLSRHAGAPLLTVRPSIEPVRVFIRKIITSIG